MPNHNMTKGPTPELKRLYAELLENDRRTARQSAEARAQELEARVEEALKFIDDYFAPWGSWKTAWWEDQVSDSAVFCGDNALRAVENKLRAPRQADEILSLPALSAPEGWVAVPREVVEPFVEAVEGGDDDRVGDHTSAWESPVAVSLTYGDFRRLHKAVLSAIPSPETAPCAYCGAVREKPCNDTLCPWAPPGDNSSWCPYTLIRQSSSPRAS